LAPPALFARAAARISSTDIFLAIGRRPNPKNQQFRCKLDRVRRGVTTQKRSSAANPFQSMGCDKPTERRRPCDIFHEPASPCFSPREPFVNHPLRKTLRGSNNRRRHAARGIVKFLSRCRASAPSDPCTPSYAAGKPRMVTLGSAPGKITQRRFAAAADKGASRSTPTSNSQSCRLLFPLVHPHIGWFFAHECACCRKWRP
jgi:hypothetical protein